MRKVIAAGSVRYPDIAVTCHPVDGRDDVVPDPVVIMEIISPSTERVDRRRKKLEYFATPSIRQYAIVEQDERLVDLYTRTETGERAKAMGVFLNGDAITEPDPRGERVRDETFLLLFSADSQPAWFTLPAEDFGHGWATSVAIDAHRHPGAGGKPTGQRREQVFIDRRYRQSTRGAAALILLEARALLGGVGQLLKTVGEFDAAQIQLETQRHA